MSYQMLGLPFINLHDIFGNVGHNRGQTLHTVVHVVLQCGILGNFSSGRTYAIRNQPNFVCFVSLKCVKVLTKN